MSRRPTPSKPRRGTWLPLNLDDHRDRTLREQLCDQLKTAMRGGRLAAGTVLPSTRTLAADLGVSRGVVVDAYTQLTEEGFLVSRAGSGTAVGDVPQHEAPRAAPPPGGNTSYEIDLRPGPPDLATFPRAAWLAATREVLSTVADAELGYVAPWGVAMLQRELADRLARVRAAVVTPQTCVVVNGATQGLSLLVRILAQRGHTRLAVESPSNAAQRQVLGRYGLTIVDVPTDEDGLDVDSLAQTGARAVLVTPAHQYPTGVVLSAARRSALIHWADRVDGLVLEDDYDPEFRFDRRPVGCLQGLGPHCVALIGSVSKSLVPGLRLGWVVAPTPILQQLREAKRDDDFGTGVLTQLAFARLLGDGGYDRHVRRVRGHYQQRRDAFVSAVTRQLPRWQVAGQAGGLHVMLGLPAEINEDRLVAAAAARGLAVQGTRSLYGTLPPGNGLVVSYARAPAGVLTEAVNRLVAAADSSAATTPAPTHPPSPTVTRPATALDYF